MAPLARLMANAIYAASRLCDATSPGRSVPRWGGASTEDWRS